MSRSSKFVSEKELFQHRRWFVSAQLCQQQYSTVPSILHVSFFDHRPPKADECSSVHLDSLKHLKLCYVLLLLLYLFVKNIHSSSMILLMFLYKLYIRYNLFIHYRSNTITYLSIPTSQEKTMPDC